MKPSHEIRQNRKIANSNIHLIWLLYWLWVSRDKDSLHDGYRFEFLERFTKPKVSVFRFKGLSTRLTHKSGYIHTSRVFETLWNDKTSFKMKLPFICAKLYLSYVDMLQLLLIFFLKPMASAVFVRFVMAFSLAIKIANAFVLSFQNPIIEEAHSPPWSMNLFTHSRFIFCK